MRAPEMCGSGARHWFWITIQSISTVHPLADGTTIIYGLSGQTYEAQESFEAIVSALGGLVASAPVRSPVSRPDLSALDLGSGLCCERPAGREGHLGDSGGPPGRSPGRPWEPRVAGVPEPRECRRGLPDDLWRPPGAARHYDVSRLRLTGGGTRVVPAQAGQGSAQTSLHPLPSTRTPGKWSVLYKQGYEIGVVCPDCQTNEERLGADEALIDNVGPAEAGTLTQDQVERNVTLALVAYLEEVVDRNVRKSRATGVSVNVVVADALADPPTFIRALRDPRAIVGSIVRDILSGEMYKRA